MAGASGTSGSTNFSRYEPATLAFFRRVHRRRRAATAASLAVLHQSVKAGSSPRPNLKLNLHTAIGPVQTSPGEEPPGLPRKLGLPRM